MKRTLLILAASTLFVSCGDSYYDSPEYKQRKAEFQRQQAMPKVVASKKEAIVTESRYKYNVFKGNFYHQPNTHTAYYLVYTDGRYDEVDLGTYTIHNIGDTVKIR